MLRIVLYCLIAFVTLSKVISARDFVTQPTVVSASPTVYLKIGEQALNNIIKNAEENCISYSVTPNIDARSEMLLGTGSTSIKLILNSCKFDFEDNSANVSFCFTVIYDVFSTPKTRRIEFAKTVNIADLSYDVSSKRIRIAINRVNEWYNYLVGLSPALPQYVTSMLINNVSNTFIYWRDWVLGQLNPEFGLPDAPVYWLDPSLTISFAFENDFLSISATPRFEAEKPHFELYGRRPNSNSQKEFMIVANAEYNSAEVLQTTIDGQRLAIYNISVTNRDGNGRNQRYYSSSFLNYSMTYSNGYIVSGRFFNSKQLIYVTWHVPTDIYINSTWKKYGGEMAISD